MTEDDKEAIAFIRGIGGLKSVCRLNTFEATHPKTEEKIVVEIRDYGNGPERFVIEARTDRPGKDKVAFGHAGPTLKDTLYGLSWEMLE